MNTPNSKTRAAIHEARQKASNWRIKNQVELRRRIRVSRLKLQAGIINRKQFSRRIHWYSLLLQRYVAQQ